MNSDNRSSHWTLTICVLVTVFLSSSTVFGGQVIDAPSLEEMPERLSPPIVVEPAYACSEGVSVTGFVPGATVEVFVNGTKVGSRVLRFPDQFPTISVPPLAQGDKISARQVFDGVASQKSLPVEVRDHTEDYPDGLPEPRIDPTPLYECGKRTASVEHVTGAELEFFSSEPGSTTYSRIGYDSGASEGHDYNTVSQAFSTTNEEAITTHYGICQDMSPMSGEEIVQPEPTTINKPTIIDKVYEGMKVVELKHLLNGAWVEVRIDGNLRGDRYIGAPKGSVWVGDMNSGKGITAQQSLCSSSGFHASPQVSVKPCTELPAPKISRPEVGRDVLFVEESLPGARIQIFDNSGEQLGEGAGTRIRLSRPIQPNEQLMARQVAGECYGDTVYQTEPAVCKHTEQVRDPSTDGQFGIGQGNYELGSVQLPPSSLTSRIAAHVRFPTKPGTDELADHGGRFPIVFILHGDHGIYKNPEDEDDHKCQEEMYGHWPEVENHRGYDYVMSALAKRGYIAVSINGNDTNCVGPHIKERGELILEHIRRWKEFAKGDGELGETFGHRVDLRDIGLLGHSKGGEAAIYAGNNDSSINGINVRSVFSLAPTDVNSYSLDELPLFVAFGAMDEDLMFAQGANIYDRSQPQENPHAFRAQKYIYGANHNFWNANWPEDDADGGGADRLTRTQQEATLREWSRAFFDQTLYGERQHRPVITGDAKVESLVDRIYPSFAAAESRTLTVDRHEDSSATTNSLGESVTQSGFSPFAEYPFRIDSNSNSYNDTFYHDTDGLITKWEAPMAEFVSELGRRDVSQFEYLSFRVTQVRQPVKDLPQDSIEINIGVVDGAGNDSVVQSDEIGTIPPPYDTSSLPLSIPDKSMLRTLRIPAACLREKTGEEGSASVDWTQLEAVRFNVGQNESGILGFDQLAFTD